MGDRLGMSPALTRMGKIKQNQIGATKRPRTEDVHSVSEAFSPKYIVLTSSDQAGEKKATPLGKMSPFFIEKAVKSLSANITEVKKMRSGDILLKCTSEADCNRILNATEMMGTKISASLHKSLNTSRGVIAVSELIDVPVEEILENLKEQGVIDVYKIKIRRNNEYIVTRNLVLTFDRPTIPEKLKVGYLSTDVRAYIPNPLRCFRCNRFGHAAGACRGSPCCARCGLPEHETKDCKASYKCVNCSGDHPAYSRSCPRWKLEKEILHIKVTQNLTFPEARKKASPFFFEKSFANAVTQKPKMHTVSCQTDFSQAAIQKSTTNKVTKQNSTTVLPQAVAPSFLPSTPIEGNSSMECDDDTSSERSFVSTGSNAQRKHKSTLSGSGSLPDITDKELAEARKKPARPRITGPKDRK